MKASRILLLAAVAALAVVAFWWPREEDAPPARSEHAPRPNGGSARLGAEELPPRGPSVGAETRPGSDTRPASDTRPGLTSPDVPEGSRDPVVDGLKTIIREMIMTGLAKEKEAELASRIAVILEIGNLAEEGRRRYEAGALAKNLLAVQDEFRPRNADAARMMTEADREQRVRAAATALAKDLYVKLAPITSSKHASGQHTGAMRAAPTMKLPDGYEAVLWKTLGGFEYVEHMQLPPEVTKLDGKKVGIAGYMMTIEEVENIREFLLVESFWSCCYGTPPTVNQVLMVQMQGPKGVEYTSQPVLILGTLEVGEKIEDGFVTSVYRLKATSVTIAE
jgi:hypothetical protein